MTVVLIILASLRFQTRTGFPGHLAITGDRLFECLLPEFQTRTGFPGHLASEATPVDASFPIISNPNGLPRPFSQDDRDYHRDGESLFQTRTGFPGHLAMVAGQQLCRTHFVSNPNGLPRPFSLGC